MTVAPMHASPVWSVTLPVASIVCAHVMETTMNNSAIVVILLKFFIKFCY